MSLIVALGLYVLFLAIYWFLTFSVLWHLKEYILPIDSSRWIVRGFLTIMAVLNIVSLFLFFQLPL